MKHRRHPHLSLISLLPLLLPSCSNTVHAEGTDLGGGIITRTPVNDQARIAYDLREMFENLPSDPNRAKNVYTAGFNSPLYDSLGNQLPNKRTIQSFSSDASGGTFTSEPTFLYHMAGLSNNFDVNTYDLHYLYADKFVLGALLNPSAGTLAAEAARALNVWMYAAHELWEGLYQCTMASTEGVNMEALGLTDNAKGAHSIDEFMAYWIGEGQKPGDSRGYALYALTQQAGELFGTLNPTGEAAANTNIKQIYENEARASLSTKDACDPGSDTVESLWYVNHSMLSQMYVPLLQMLIHNMLQGDVARVKLYAISVIPQVAQCRPSTYRRLKDALIDKDYDTGKKNDVLNDLQSVYGCLGISCKDIGAYQTDVLGACSDPPDSFPMAEYSPSTPVLNHAKIDLDIWNMKLLLSYGEVSYPMAKYLYLHGKHSHLPIATSDQNARNTIFRTLHSLAISQMRKKALPYFDEFVKYFNDAEYADNIILDSLDLKGRWGDSNSDITGVGTFDQRYEVITKIVQYQVVFIHLLAEMNDAIEDCRNQDINDNDGDVSSWDEIAAYIVGSMEGSDEGGSKDFNDGQFIWNLGNKRSVDFSTVNEKGYAMVNSEIEDLLFAGKGMIESYDCADLTKVVTRIRNMMFIPLIQSVIRYAVKNEGLSYESNHEEVAEGEAFTLCILPVIRYHDKKGAETIERNMLSPITRSRFDSSVKDGQGTSAYVADGPQVVADAFWRTMKKLDLPSKMIGSLAGADPSARGDINGGFSMRTFGLVTAMLSISVTVIGLI
eukprot:CAMPEP_0185728082 /NCGR_PEP_ID=MMETSP1171-20130828/3562_1 /TAXON_ID=374046 /ORGANISM="Helicotheca tamensis, Strain CCMP826" /LENGTH=779 /DNA_ID=CAMNT_0028396751 /DNA_START=147 /DNA_END=2486 /DNA_ORIENTATION=-